MAAKRKSSAARQVEPARAAPTLSNATNARDFELKNPRLRVAARFGIDRRLLICLALALLTLGVYAQVWQFDFVTIDDPQYVVTNPHVRSGLTLAGLKWSVDRFYFANWAPLTWLSLMADASAYDAWAGGYHMTNVIIHLANVLLLFHLLRKATEQEFLSFFVAALFAVHPIHAESVAWISERKDVLSVFFGLLSLSAYVNYARRQRMASLAASLVFFAMSLMSKQTLVTLPCVLLLLDYWPLGRITRRCVVEKVPFFAISAVFGVVAMLAQANSLTVRSLDAIPLPLRVANAAVAYTSYLQKAILPWNLGVYYPYSTDLGLIRVAASVALLTLITAAAIDSRRRWPFFAVGWFWFVGTLAPLIGIVQVGTQQMADRYAYFSFIGLYLAIAGFVTSRAVAVAAVGLAAVLGFIQVGYWHDALSLVEHTARVTDDNSFVRFALGDALLAQGQLDDALEQYRHAVVVEPADPGPHCKFGEALFRFDHRDDARREFQIALALDDRLAAAHRGLGWFYLARNETAAAKREFEQALDADPGDQDNYYNLALLQRNLGDFAASIEKCRGALAINDNMLAAQRLLADDLMSLKRYDEAADRLREILMREPNDDESRRKLQEIQGAANHQ